MGKKAKKQEISCACGFLTKRNAVVGTECPMCHTRLKIRKKQSRVFTKANRNDLYKAITKKTMYILSIDVEDSSDVLNYKETWTIHLEDENRQRYTIKVDIPKYYAMNFYDMEAWASQICYVRTPLVRESDIHQLNDDGFAAHKIEVDEVDSESSEKKTNTSSVEKSQISAQYKEFEKRVCEIGRVEFSDGYFGLDPYTSRRERMEAYAKAMSRKCRLLLFEYEPIRYVEGGERYKVENPYKPNAKSISFDLELTNRNILNVDVNEWEAIGGTRAQARIYAENRVYVAIPDRTVRIVTPNADLCKANRRGSIYPQEWIDRINKDGVVGIKYLLNGGELRWCRFGELAVFSKYIPFCNIEALMPVRGIMSFNNVGDPESTVVRVRFDNGFAKIMYDDPMIANPYYTMNFYDMEAWASQICYVRTPLVRESDIHQLNDDGFAAHKIEVDEVDSESSEKKTNTSSVEPYTYGMYVGEAPEDEDADVVVEKQCICYKFTDGKSDYGYLMFDWIENINTWAFYDHLFRLVDCGAKFGTVDIDEWFDELSHKHFAQVLQYNREIIDFDWLMDKVDVPVGEIDKRTMVVHKLLDGTYLRIRMIYKKHYEWENFNKLHERVRSGDVKNFKKIEDVSKHIISFLETSDVATYQPVSIEFIEFCDAVKSDKEERVDPLTASRYTASLNTDSSCPDGTNIDITIEKQAICYKLKYGSMEYGYIMIN